MALYAIGDTHLSFRCNKSMDVFGGAWENYVEKLTEGFSVVKPDDTVVLCGDLSWGMNFEQAEEDFAFLDSLPGQKVILKGNHDYWWTTAAKMNRFFEEKNFRTFHLLHNNCYFYENVALCGTRGWFFEEHGDQKVFNRELMRLETSLKAAGDRDIYCFLHYPPYYQGYTCREIIDLLRRYRVKACYYGHLHGGSHRLAMEGRFDSIEYYLVSADYLEFKPKKIIE